MDVLRPRLENYNSYTKSFLKMCEARQLRVWINYENIDDLICGRKTYSLNICYKVRSNVLNVWPVLLGSAVDMYARKNPNHKLGQKIVINSDTDYFLCEPNEAIDYFYGCFIIGGILKYVPNQLHNDQTNLHYLFTTKQWRLYAYDEHLFGIEIAVCADKVIINSKKGEKRTITSGDELIKETCKVEPYSTLYSLVDLNKYSKCAMECYKLLYDYASLQPFEIDNLANKKVYTAGELLFRQTRYLLFGHLHLPNFKKYATMCKNFINTGQLCQNISKTDYPSRSQKSANEIEKNITTKRQFLTEKKNSTYRGINSQIYPLVPFLNEQVNRNLSSNVQNPKPLSFDRSFLGFLCYASTTDTRNVGKSLNFVKGVRVSTEEMNFEGYKEIVKSLSITYRSRQKLVTINNVPFFVAKFPSINVLHSLKNSLPYFEYFFKTELWLCLQINTAGRLFRSEENITCREALFQPVNKNNTTSHIADVLLPLKNHNMAAKMYLTLTTAKNAIFNTRSELARYLFETNSRYIVRDRMHTLVPDPHWPVKIPVFTQIVASCDTLTSEDCCVFNAKSWKGTIVETSTIKLFIQSKDAISIRDIRFSPAIRKSRQFLGTLYNPFRSAFELSMINFNGSVQRVNSYTYRIYSTRPQFEWRIVKFSLVNNNFFLYMEAHHNVDTGDKICSWNGQKGMIFVTDNFYEHDDVVIDCAISPSCLQKRQTMGHVIDMLQQGGTMRTNVRLNNKEIQGAFLIGDSNCMLVNNLGPNHMYASKDDCNEDAVSNQAVKGCIRNGGYKICQQDLFSALFPRGLVQVVNEIHDRGDKIILDNRMVIPKTSLVSQEIIKHFNKKIKLTHQDNVFIGGGDSSSS